MFPKDADIRSASVDGDRGGAVQLELGVATCNADLAAEVDETEDEITITVTARNESRNDCSDVLVVDLTHSLGDRAVVDGSDGEELFVEERPPN